MPLSSFSFFFFFSFCYHHSPSCLSLSFLLRSCPNSFFLFLITTFSPLLPYLVLLISRFYYPPLLIPFTFFLSLASYPFQSFLRGFLITHNRSHCLCPSSLPSPPVIRDRYCLVIMRSSLQNKTSSHALFRNVWSYMRPLHVRVVRVIATIITKTRISIERRVCHYSPPISVYSRLFYVRLQSLHLSWELMKHSCR